jgi:DNA-3-methyladenine glycosylase
VTLSTLEPLPASALEGRTEEVARRLLGCTLVSRLGGAVTAGIIVETEAYGSDDPACHAFRGPTARNAAMFMAAGTLYVYRIYGVHCCANVVTGPAGVGEAVLIRALEPVQGQDAMHSRRGVEEDRMLCSGPGKLCAALGIDVAANGSDLFSGPVTLLEAPAALQEVRVGPRIGVTKAADRHWRFCVAGSCYVSRK